jgi:hypothetical protein
VVVQIGRRGEAGVGVDGAGGGQRGAALFEVALGAGELGERLQAGQQLDIADALGDEVGGAGALGLDPHVRLVVAGDDHHRQRVDARQAR